MGLFDYIKVECEMPEPAPPPELRMFQTKHFDAPYMDTYRITEDGRLVYEDYQIFTVPEEERPFYGKPEWDGDFAKIAGSQGRRPLGDKDLDFHGDIEFWSDTSHGKEWWEFRARFTNGKLENISLVEHRLPAQSVDAV